MLPLSNELSSAVTVWVAEPVFVHVTLEPALTVTEVGLNAKSTIETAFAAPPPLAAGPPPPVLGAGVLLELQATPTSATARPKVASHGTRRVRSNIWATSCGVS